ncbi:unnamed protein product [Candidula unifasciata]|uniref:Kinesin motor domain-containing protein n=1 Tax=Candidula unifasciata TaxID=100452 RepID=A0A8S3YKU9_9EUPU|nr:unnamed protein product [Candidula unifasciata]
MAHIKTYARLKPSKKVYPGYEVDSNTLRIHIVDNKECIFIDPQQVANRGCLSYEVSFTEIFNPASTQEDVFNVAAKDIIQNFLNGYNGTIFAYGQTGTGKTYTVEGNTHQYCSRGLSTRALSMIYQYLARRVDDHISVYLSYLEIYQEVAYDLLNPTSRPPVPIPPFAKNITVCEGPQESPLLRGLTLQPAANEEIAQMLLLQGQANRKISETPTNQRSSRSHAVFTVYLQARKHDSKVTLKSKLHLVDLAGSERVSKTGADGQQLTEAKSINLSLHHLESVIIALQSDRVLIANSLAGEDKSMDDNLPTQSRSVVSVTSGPSSDGGRPCRFVPYRNSLLTMLLKDSLGGNCLTAMIATISMEPENLGESVSTCRFAQRVARVANNARRNEEIDDKALISRLRQKISCIKHELVKSQGDWRSLYSYDDLSDVLSRDDKAQCARIMEGFLQGDILDPVAAGICDRYRFLECLHLLKERCQQSQAALTQLLTGHRQKASSPGLFFEALTESSRDYNGDQRMSEAFQLGESLVAGYQRPAGFTTSEGSMDISEEFFSASDNNGVCVTNPECFVLERKESESSHSQESYSEEKYPFKSSRLKLKTEENSEQTIRNPEPENPHSRKPEERQQTRKPEEEHQHARKPEEEHQDDQEPIEKLKSDMQYQRLLETESSFRLKLKVLEQQLLDHQAYIQWLRNNKADPSHIAKELYVERNQLKIQARFQEKLNKLLDKKAKLMYSISLERQKSPFIRQCCKKSSYCDKNSPCNMKCKTGCCKQITPRNSNDKSALRIKDLTFKVAASLNRCGDLKETSPLPADVQLQKDKGRYHPTDDDLTPTVREEYSGNELRGKTPKISNQQISQEVQTCPDLSRQYSGQELQQKTSKISNQRQKHLPALSRQELRQKAPKISNKNTDKDQEATPGMFIQQQDQQAQAPPIAKQHTEKAHSQKISDHIADLHQLLTSPRISKQADWELQQRTPEVAKPPGNHEKLSPRLSKHQVRPEFQQLTPEILKQHADQELQHIFSKLQTDKELQQNLKTLSPTTVEPRQKSPRMTRQYADRMWLQNTKMSRPNPDRMKHQDSQIIPKECADHKTQSGPDYEKPCIAIEAPQNSRSKLAEKVVVSGRPVHDPKFTISVVVDKGERNIAKVESISEESQSTEKQVNAIEDYMVVD